MYIHDTTDTLCTTTIHVCDVSIEYLFLLQLVFVYSNQHILLHVRLE